MNLRALFIPCQVSCSKKQTNSHRNKSGKVVVFIDSIDMKLFFQLHIFSLSKIKTKTIRGFKRIKGRYFKFNH